MNVIVVENDDTCYKSLDIISHQEDGDYLYCPQAGDVITLTVNNRKGENVFTQEYNCTGDDESITLDINTNITEGKYQYTIKIDTATGETHTIIKNAELIIE